MPHLFRHARHLIRMATLFLLGGLAFLGIRAALVPKDFGHKGHYREGALADNASRPLVHAGRAACMDCHGDIPEAMKTQGSGHRTIGCESCHGPQAAHASSEDPSQSKPKLPEARPLCLGCHAKDSARPAFVPQQDPKTHHPKDRCTDCHNPHAPRLEDGK